MLKLSSNPSGGHLDSRWSPCGVQMDFQQKCRVKSFLDGVHLESRWIYGVHLESIWNPWGRVKYWLLSSSSQRKETSTLARTIAKITFKKSSFLFNLIAGARP